MGTIINTNSTVVGDASGRETTRQSTSRGRMITRSQDKKAVVPSSAQGAHRKTKDLTKNIHVLCENVPMDSSRKRVKATATPKHMPKRVVSAKSKHSKTGSLDVFSPANAEKDVPLQNLPASLGTTSVVQSVPQSVTYPQANQSNNDVSLFSKCVDTMSGAVTQMRSWCSEHPFIVGTAMTACDAVRILGPSGVLKVGAFAANAVALPILMGNGVKHTVANAIVGGISYMWGGSIRSELAHVGAATKNIRELKAGNTVAIAKKAAGQLNVHRFRLVTGLSYLPIGVANAVRVALAKKPIRPLMQSTMPSQTSSSLSVTSTVPALDSPMDGSR